MSVQTYGSGSCAVCSKADNALLVRYHYEAKFLICQPCFETAQRTDAEAEAIERERARLTAQADHNNQTMLVLFFIVCGILLGIMVSTGSVSCGTGATDIYGHEYECYGDE